MHLESYQVQQLREILREEIRNVIQEIKQGEIVKPPPPLNIKGVCDRYDITPATVHNLRKKGTLEGFKVGKGRFFHIAEIEKAFNQYKYQEVLERKGLKDPNQKVN